MQTSTLIAAGITAATSAAVALEDGESATLNFLGDGKLMLISVTDGGVEQDVETLLSSKARMLQLLGPLRFKIRRNACAAAVGLQMFRS